MEAACVLPMVLGIYVFLIYGMFFQYDRCLAEQEAVVAAMEGTFDGEDSWQGYLAWEWKDREITIEKGKTLALIEGNVAVPFEEIRQWITGRGWNVEALFSKRRMAPAAWIRSFRKIMDIGETDD